MKLNLERNYEWKWRRERVFGFKDGMMCESNDGGCENRLFVITMASLFPLKVFMVDSDASFGAKRIKGQQESYFVFVMTLLINVIVCLICDRLPRPLRCALN